MRLVRFQVEESDTPLSGIYADDHVTVMVGDPYSGMIVGTSEKYPVDQIHLLPPCVPTKVVAVGLNYRDHAAELGMPIPEEPLIFLKPPSSVTGPGKPIKCPKMSNQVEYEGELGVVIGQRTKKVAASSTKNYILGYTCLNDVTARDLQKKDVQFTRAKSFDTFCPIGPWIETELDPSNLRIQSRVNGQTRQDSSTSQLIHSVYDLISFISHVMTLEPGDVIATGTPKGVGPLNKGDRVEIEVEGIGVLENTVR